MDVNVTSDVELRQSFICRCCLQGGCYKNISSEYYYSGDIEKYDVMLKDTFDLQVSYFPFC